MVDKKLIPYSVYLPREYHNKLKTLAQSRQASALIRDAISMIVDGNDAFRAGYNKGIRDACKIITECEEAQIIAVKGQDIGGILTDRIQELEMQCDSKPK